ncbi:MAG: M20/M25/M40 family metallo-hydrolase [Clostridiales bacterium]|nr:M20/M25/M40 family metallo-hydrolase [Clostridiales bacterium]
MWIYFLLGFVGLLVLFILAIVIRTLSFKPKDKIAVDETVIEQDKDLSVHGLQELVKCKTVSYFDKTLEDEREFEKLENLIPTLYPNFTANCERIKIDARCMFFHWKGLSNEKVSVMMSHYDVVPVDESKWDVAPFEGVLKDGVLWGRGALDTKATLNAVLRSADTLIKDGFVPKNDVYFAFSGGEEISSDGASKIVDYFEQNGINVDLVVDEGGAVVENVFPGVKAPCGLIGIAEKGMIDLKYTVSSSGGHASAPKPNSPVVRLAKACSKLEKKPLKAHVTKPVKEMFNTLGRHSTFVYKMIFSNLWLFKGLLDKICVMGGGELNALMRTTFAFTQTKGSDAPNIIPTEASMVSNIRINPMDDMDKVLKHVEKTVKDDKVTLTVLHGTNPSRISQTDCDSFNKVASAIASTWKGAVVSPYLMVQCSDSRHYGRISDKVYRFSAMDMTNEERATVHGNNERIRVETIYKSVEFYTRLLKNC